MDCFPDEWRRLVQDAHMNVDALWIGVHLATFDAGYGIVDDGAIAVRNGRIVWLGPRTALPVEMIPAVTHDGRGAWLTPGLIDCHTHLVWAGNRAREFEQRLHGATYAEIAAAGGGIRATMRATRAADESRLLAQSARRLRELLAEGVTTVEIKSGYGLDLQTEARVLAVARALGQSYPVHVVTTFLGAHSVPPEYAGHADAYIDAICTRMLPELHAQGLVDAVDAYCEAVAFTPAQVSRVFDAAIALGLPVKLHADQLSDSDGALLAARHCALSADHLEYANDEGIEALAASGAVAVLLPGAYYLLRETQPPPVDALRRRGVPMAIATDCNPGTSPCTSILLMLNMACTLFSLTPEEALAGVTRHAARALGLHADRGRLVPGLRADFALWDIEHPVDLVYRLGGLRCLGRVVDGNPVAA